MNLEQRIAAMEAKDEIRELTARYCHGVTDGDALPTICNTASSREPTAETVLSSFGE
jgi:hypothetical protein